MLFHRKFKIDLTDEKTDALYKYRPSSWRGGESIESNNCQKSLNSSQSINTRVIAMLSTRVFLAIFISNFYRPYHTRRSQSGFPLGPSVAPCTRYPHGTRLTRAKKNRKRLRPWRCYVTGCRGGIPSRATVNIYLRRVSRGQYWLLSSQHDQSSSARYLCVLLYAYLYQWRIRRQAG